MKWFVIFFYLFTVCSSDDFSQKNGESPEEYATRLLARHAYESNDEYEVRIAFLKVLKPNLPIWKNYDYLKYITVDGSSTNRPPYVPKYLEDIIQKTGESSDKYYKRIFKRYPEESDYEYMERISILRGLLNLQNIWIDNNFMRYVTPYILKRVEDDFSNRKSSPSSIEQQHKTDDGQSDYYKNLKRRSDESAEGYYTRILTRHAYESNDEFEVRIAFLQPLTPSLPIWKNYEYLNYITVENNSSRPPYEPKYLEDLVQKKDENSYEYYKRIFEWHSDENEYQYMERVAILRGLLNTQKIWMDNNFMTYVKPHILKILQKEQSSKHTLSSTTSQQGNISTKPLSINAEDESTDKKDNLPPSSQRQSSVSVGNDFRNEKSISTPSKIDHKVGDSDGEDENEFNSAAAYNKRDDESLRSFCMRIFAKRPFEPLATYRRTIKRMMERWLQFEMWREKCKPYVDLDALLSFNKYNRLDGESKSAYCRRLFEKRFYETDDKYKGRIERINARFSGFATWKKKCKEYVNMDNLHVSE